MFLTLTFTIYAMEFFILVIKNLMHGNPLFDFPIGFIYIGFL